MRQVVRRVVDRQGRVRLIELPEPHCGPEQILVQTAYTLISSGTELGTLAKTPLELVRQTVADPWMRHVVRQTVFATGVRQTLERVWSELFTPRELGYAGAGTVLAVGENVEGFGVGDKVAFAASGHAEIVAPTINHVAAVPSPVDLRHAAFSTVGAIAIHALRRAERQLGESVAIYGLGLVGQLCAAVARAAGLRVVGIDVSDARTALAARGGADLVIQPSRQDLHRRIMDFTEKQGVDATIICARSRSDEIINAAMEITRRRGCVVIVGYVGLDIHPKQFLYREIDLRYSRAYGPGSYHNAYEKGRVDYPVEYVRWTQRRNLEEFVRLLRGGRLDLEALIGGVYPIAAAQEAFEAITTGNLPSVAALLSYGTGEPDRRRTLSVHSRPRADGKIGIAVVGAGNHVLGKHLPNLRRLQQVDLRGIASATGRRAQLAAERFRATTVTTDVGELLTDPGTDAVMVCSSQHEHYRHLRQVIEAGKAVFVEKPMVTRVEHWRDLDRLMAERPVLFTLGLNRRYSPLVVRALATLEGQVDAVLYTVAQPYTPPEHWTLDEIEGGGRLITEGEHFIDLCNLFIGKPPVRVTGRALGPPPEDLRRLSSFAISLDYGGAVANITFSECGAAGYPRERVTVLGRGQVLVIDQFSVLTVHGRRVRRHGHRLRAEMGHQEELVEFVAALRGEPNSMLGWEEASRATLAMFAAQESIRSGLPVDLEEFARALRGDPPQ